MNLQELLAAVEALSPEDKKTFFAKKNAKLNARESRITELETQVTNFETADKDRAGKALKDFIGTQGRTHKVVSALTKDFERAALEALNENSKLGDKALDQEAVIKTLLTDNKHYTNASVSKAGVVVIDEGDKKVVEKEPTSMADILRAAQKK